MIYRTSGNRLWDAWIFPWEGRYHMFHCRTNYIEEYTVDDGGYTHIGRAVSDDMIRWEELPPIRILSDRPEDWNRGHAFTGTTTYYNGRFYLFVTCDKNRQSVLGAFSSDDLMSPDWERVSDAPELVSKAPYVTGEEEGIRADWRDIDIMQDEDGWFHGVITAKMGEINCDSTGSVIAHVRSKNLKDWEYLPPLFDGRNRFRHTEVPGIFRWGDWYYLTFNTTSLGGMRVNTPTRVETGGTYYMKSRNLTGPYEMAEECALVTGCSMVLSDYSGRVVRRGDDYVVWHLSSSYLSATASPKLLRQAEDGTLTVHYDPMMAKLQTERLEPGFRCTDGGRWKAEGKALRGGALVRGTSCILREELTDGVLTVRVTPGTSARCGVIVHGHAELPALSFLLDAERNLLSFGRAEGDGTMNRFAYNPEYYVKTEMTVLRKIDPDRSYEIRVLFRDTYFECYLDGEYIFSWGGDRIGGLIKKWMPGCFSEEGALELYVERGDARFEDVEIYAMEPLPRPDWQIRKG